MRQLRSEQLGQAIHGGRYPDRPSIKRVPCFAPILALQRSAGNRATGAFLAVQRQREGKVVRERVVDARVTDEQTKTVVSIQVVGHASPRWRSAKSPRAADRRNAVLSEQRAQAVRRSVEQEVRAILPNRDLVFEYDYCPADTVSEPADVLLGSESVGSSETLREAGKRGRSANDAAMRRVEVKVGVYKATDTDVVERREQTRRVSAATRNWSVMLAGEIGGGAGPVLGALTLMLKNRDIDETGLYWGAYSGGGGGLTKRSKSIASASGDWDDFQTKVPLSFRDFHWAQFTLAGASIGIGIGVEIATLRIFNFTNGAPSTGPIEVGGFKFGGFGADIKGVTGNLQLKSSPREWKNETTTNDEAKSYRSEDEEHHSHTVVFGTASASISPGALVRLRKYLGTVVAHK